MWTPERGVNRAILPGAEAARGRMKGEDVQNTSVKIAALLPSHWAPWVCVRHGQLGKSLSTRH